MTIAPSSLRSSHRSSSSLALPCLIAPSSLRSSHRSSSSLELPSLAVLGSVVR
jgi:hypothetical protein